MPGSAAFSLDSVSVLLVWTAIAIYVLAFVAYAVDLARRGAQAAEVQDAATREHELVSVAAAGASSAASGVGVGTVTASATGRAANTRLRDQERAAEVELDARPSDRPRLFWARIGTALTVLGFLFHVAGDITRGFAAGRVPWSNMYEFALTGTMLIVAVYLVSLLRYDLRFLGTFITGLVVLLLGGATLYFWVEITPLMDPLKSIWLVIHVFVASLATALFALAFGLSVMQLMQSRRERRTAAMAVPTPTPDAVPAAPPLAVPTAPPLAVPTAPPLAAGASSGASGRVGPDASSGASDRVGPAAATAIALAEAKTGPRFLRTLPGSDALESIAYRFAILGFIFWTFTLIAGSIWANDAWGRYWGFDTKEVWTFVIWVLYAGYIHARATRGWRGSRSAWLSIIGFTAVLFNFTIVNMFFKGLHAYSGLS